MLHLPAAQPHRNVILLFIVSLSLLSGHSKVNAALVPSPSPFLSCMVLYLAMALEDSTLYEWTIKWIGREELSF
jgi:hypothetical protein